MAATSAVITRPARTHLHVLNKRIPDYAPTRLADGLGVKDFPFQKDSPQRWVPRSTCLKNRRVNSAIQNMVGAAESRKPSPDPYNKSESMDFTISDCAFRAGTWPTARVVRG